MLLGIWRLWSGYVLVGFRVQGRERGLYIIDCMVVEIGRRGLLPAREKKSREEKVGKAAWVVDWVRFVKIAVGFWLLAGGRMKIGFVSRFWSSTGPPWLRLGSFRVFSLWGVLGFAGANGGVEEGI